MAIHGALKVEEHHLCLRAHCLYGASQRRAADLLVGRGGVGMMEMALARILFATAALVTDIDAGKREAALRAGAAAAYDPAAPAARKAVTAATGGVHGVCDFVG